MRVKCDLDATSFQGRARARRTRGDHGDASSALEAPRLHRSAVTGGACSVFLVATNECGPRFATLWRVTAVDGVNLDLALEIHGFPDRWAVRRLDSDDPACGTRFGHILVNMTYLATDPDPPASWVLPYRPYIYIS